MDCLQVLADQFRFSEVPVIVFHQLALIQNETGK